MKNPIRETAREDRASMWRRRRALGAAIALAVSCGAPAYGIDVFWTGDTSTDWNTAANWDPERVPEKRSDTDFDDAIINIAGANAPTITANLAATPRDIAVGFGPATTGVLNHNAGTAATGAGNWMFVGRNGGNGTYNLTGSGSMNVGGRLYVAGHDGAAATGTVNVNTTGTLAIGNDLNLGAAGGTGTVNIDAGTVTVGAWISIGRDENGLGGTGNLNLRGGTLTTNLNTMVALPGTTGNLRVTGGTLTSNEDFITGDRAGSNGTSIIDNGTVNTNRHLIIGRETGRGAVTVNGGTVATAGETWVGNDGGNGTMTVNGGTVSTNNWLAVGRNGSTGVLTVTGTGTFNKTGDGHITIGTGAGGNGLVNVSGGGTLTTNNNLILAENNATAVGTVNQTGGTVRIGGDLVLQGNAEGTPTRGTYSLSGGTLIVDGKIDAMTAPPGDPRPPEIPVGVFNFTGGRLTRSNAGVITVDGALATGGTAATIDLDSDKTFDVNGALNVLLGGTFDVTGLSVTPATTTASFTLGTVDSIVGTFAPPLHAVTGFNSGGATFISELNGENGLWSGGPVFWLQESGGRVSLEYRTVVPEPGSLAVLGLSALALLARRRQT